MAHYGLIFYNSETFDFAEDSDDFIVENVKRVLMTRPGERVNNPAFGSKLSAYLFEPEMLMDDLAREIRTSLTKWEPRAEILNLALSYKDECVSITLKIRNKTNNNEIETNFLMG